MSLLHDTELLETIAAECARKGRPMPRDPLRLRGAMHDLERENAHLRRQLAAALAARDGWRARYQRLDAYCARQGTPAPLSGFKYPTEDARIEARRKTWRDSQRRRRLRRKQAAAA